MGAEAEPTTISADTPATTPPPDDNQSDDSPPSVDESLSDHTFTPAEPAAAESHETGPPIDGSDRSSTQSSKQGLIHNPEAFVKGAVGEGTWTETPLVDETRAAEIATQAHEEWDVEGHPDEEYLRMAARGHLPTVTETDTARGQPAEYAVVDQYNKQYTPTNKRRTNTDSFEYV